jgi:hypothetical protein
VYDYNNSWIVLELKELRAGTFSDIEGLSFNQRETARVLD